MKRLLIGVLVALLACLLCAAPVNAETPAEHIAPYLKRAELFWADRGGYVNCPLGINVQWESLDGAAAAAGGGGQECHLWLDPESWQQRGPKLRCFVILHEYGHLIGLEHEPTGIMQETSMWDPYLHPTKRCRRFR